MVKTKLAVIQDDILAVKHALANNLSFEGLEGEQLNNVLQTLLAQRAQESATTASSSGSPGTTSPQHACSSSGSGGGSSSRSRSSSSSNSNNNNTISRTPVNGIKTAAASKNKGKKKTPAAAPAASNKPLQTTAAPKASPPSAAKTPAAKTPAPSEQQRQQRQASSGKAAKKRRTSGSIDGLRQLRKSIGIGDKVSVLMDSYIAGAWEKEWFEGEVVREMNRSGIFQIAFDRDRYGNKGAVKQEPSGTGASEEDMDRRIHEQRLQIDHPDFFCGQGDTPPVGVDICRPRGAWFLHQRADVVPPAEQEQEQQQQPGSEPVVSPPVGGSRVPHNLTNGGGGESSGGGSGGGSGSGSTSSIPALPQSHMAWGPVSNGHDSEDLGSSAVAAAAQASADAADSLTAGA